MIYNTFIAVIREYRVYISMPLHKAIVDKCHVVLPINQLLLIVDDYLLETSYYVVDGENRCAKFYSPDGNYLMSLTNLDHYDLVWYKPPNLESRLDTDAKNLKRPFKFHIEQCFKRGILLVAYDQHGNYMQQTRYSGLRTIEGIIAAKIKGLDNEWLKTHHIPIFDKTRLCVIL